MPTNEPPTFTDSRRAEAESQIIAAQRTVAFDTKEFTAELLVNKLTAGEITIPPYQREFIWSDAEQSKFIESMVIGLPIPFMFAAESEDSANLEILDGAQRIQTLRRFFQDDLALEELEKLDQINDFRYSDLPIAQRRRLKNRSLRMVVIPHTADIDVRFDLFERINSHGRKLLPAELRRGAFTGPFYDIVRTCAELPAFRAVCPMSESLEKSREREELALRFFAYAERYQQFDHDVAKFLNQFLRDKNSIATHPNEITFFTNMLTFVEQHFPNGFAKRATSRQTPRVRFESISVGVHLALQQNPRLVPRPTALWLDSADFKQLTTTHASNSGPKLRRRIEYVRDQLLEV